jgi:thiol-disulfide isomerase/thioredoxin
MKILERWKTKKLSGKISDIVFILLVVAMLIPPVRREVSSFVLRLTLRAPKVTHEESSNKLKPEDLHWEIQNMEGEVFFLKEYIGKPVFINFWATWCPPCRAEMPSVQELYNKHKENVQFLMVSYEEKSIIKDFLESKGYNLPVYTSQYRAPDKLYSTTLPTTFIISPTGEIVLSHQGTANWNSEKVNNLLTELSKEK